MTVTSDIQLDQQQHLVLSGVDWEFYEHVLGKIGDRPIRVTYFDGTIEIMAPLSKHEVVKKAIARLVETMMLDLDMSGIPFGSTTFREEAKGAGLEPDECYYLKNPATVMGMEKFDPEKFPPPDLAIEVDITRRSVPRQPIYAALGVPELWRFDGQNLEVMVLGKKGYSRVHSSPAFPFLKMDQFSQFVHRLLNEDSVIVLKDFRKWVAGLARS